MPFCPLDRSMQIWIIPALLIFGHVCAAQKPQAKASSSQPPTPVAGPSSALQPHALAPPVSPQAESPRLSSSRLDDADILALRQQLEALHARCTAMQAEHDAQRNESVQQHEAVTHELAASTATLKHLEAHAAKNDAEIARLSGLLSGWWWPLSQCCTPLCLVARNLLVCANLNLT